VDTQPNLPGIHHVTAITSDAQRNIDFYCGVLGLRLVKLTVNFDDPRSYHLYYGDAQGSPGSILTFFAWPGIPRGRSGPPQVTATSYAVPVGATDYWATRLRQLGVTEVQESERFGARVLSFEDPDGMDIELVAAPETAMQIGDPGAVPAEYAIRSFHGVTLEEEGYEKTARLLTDTMGFSLEGNAGNRFRYRAAGSGSASVVDLLCVPDARRGGMGGGIVHHVAFRTPDDAQQESIHAALVQQDLNVSPIIDRSYFHSIYFREPGGVLFEIATDIPGFAVDEPAGQLGTGLRLPPWYEPHRVEIVAGLRPLRLPQWGSQHDLTANP
jgi:glyoxalase family protein